MARLRTVASLRCAHRPRAGLCRGVKAKPDVIRVWLDRSTGVGLNSWPNYLQALDHFQRAAEEILMEGKRQWIVPECPNIKAAAGTCLSSSRVKPGRHSGDGRDD